MASNLLTRYVVPTHPVAVWCLLSIHSRLRDSSFLRTREYSENILPPKFDLFSQELFDGFGIRSYTSMPKYDALDQMSKKPVIPSMLYSTVEGKYYNIDVPGLEKTESDEALCVFVYMPGVEMKDVGLFVAKTNLLNIQGKTNETRYSGFMKFPKNIDETDLKAEMEDGMFKLTFPKVKGKEFENFVSNFIFKLKIRFDAWVTYVLRGCIKVSFLKELCPEPFSSLTMYKEDTAKSMRLNIIREIEKMELTREGVCVFLNMPEIKIEDMKARIQYDALFIEGKAKLETKKVHYITGIRLPESIFKRSNMVKMEMQDGMYKVTVEILR